MSYFPDRLFDGAGPYASEYFTRMAAAAATIDPDAISAAGALIGRTIASSGRLYSCGNGGSAAMASAAVGDCLKGIRTGTEL